MKTESIDDIYQQIGQRIIEGRKSKGMSQEQLAQESGIDRSHMGLTSVGTGVKLL